MPVTKQKSVYITDEQEVRVNHLADILRVQKGAVLRALISLALKEFPAETIVEEVARIKGLPTDYLLDRLGEAREKPPASEAKEHE